MVLCSIPFAFPACDYPISLSVPPSLPCWKPISRPLVFIGLSPCLCCLFPLLWVRFKRLGGCIRWEHSSSPSDLNIMALPPSLSLLTFTSALTRLPWHQSYVQWVASHNPIQYQPWSVTSTSSQLLNVIGWTLETTPSFSFLPEVKGNLIFCFMLKRTMALDVEIAKEITSSVVSCGQVG